jgi:hypothetical protein
MISEALHPDIFEQPLFNNLLNSSMVSPYLPPICSLVIPNRRSRR